MTRSFLQPLLSLPFLLVTSGCSSLTSPVQTARTLTQEAQMDENLILAPPFTLTSFSRIAGPKHGPLRVYIEGDGRAWMSRTRPSPDPTPRTPVALKLAAIDTYPNVLYLARPCQYSRQSGPDNTCHVPYWTDKRFAPEVITAMNHAVSQAMDQYHFQTLELIGFSGGGNVAALLAARRHDVVNLRTVAGNIDHTAHTRYHKVTPMLGSLNAADYTHSLHSIPQIHYVGAEDKNVTKTVYASYARRMPSLRCTQMRRVTPATHTRHWEEHWLRLLSASPRCE